MRRIHYIAILCCFVLTSSCASNRDLFQPQSPDLIDPDLKLNRDDYKNFTNPDRNKKEGTDRDGGNGATNATEPPIPDMAEILAAPRPPKLGDTQLVSIAVTDDVPLKDVLVELARLADVDIEVDSTITGGITFRAKERPFNEVIERISDLAGLRYSMKNNILRVERDTPYVQIYSLDFLNLDRNSTSNVSISTSVLSSSGTSGGSSSGSGSSGSSGGSGGGSGGGGGGGGGLSNGSSSNVTATANSDFWKQFEESVKSILSYNADKRTSAAAVATQPNAPAAAATPAAGASSPAATPGTPSQTVKSGDKANGDTFYIISRQASTMTVSATEKQHELLTQFIRKIQANGSAQVLIDAKIVEVTLDDEFQSGIDWTKLGGNKISFAGNFSAPDVTTAVTQAATFDIGQPHQLAFMKNLDLSAAVQLAQKFGTTRTLSSPRLHAANNQQAVLTFAENFVYFSLNVTQTQATTAVVGTTPLNTTTVNSTAHTVPIGIILSLQPSINLDTNEVTMSVRPTLSRIVSSVSDPAVAYSLAQAKAQGIDVSGISSSVPIIEVRELDSILKLQSGQVMVIGGLMQDVSNNSDAGIPGASSIPIFGNLFKGVDKENKVQELVIFIRATIVDTSGSASRADKELYKKFTRDPRPLDF